MRKVYVETSKDYLFGGGMPGWRFRLVCCTGNTLREMVRALVAAKTRERMESGKAWHPGAYGGNWRGSC